MSEFKAGDCVVYKDSNKYKNHLFKVVDVEDGIAIAVEAGQECFVYFPDMRLAKDPEIAAGHRIDSPADQVFKDAVEHGHGFAMVSIEGVKHVSLAQVINPFPCEELGDDFPIENHISPLCEVKG